MINQQPIDLFTASPLSPRRRAAPFEPHETADLLGFPRRLTTFRDATERERITSIRGKSVECDHRPFTVAALYVATDGCYFDLPGVDPWDLSRDARAYAGPWPVVAHPPCERWGRYWGGSPTQWPRLVKGDDGGCFAAALAAVRQYGGVLEHPADSFAWKHFGLNLPPDCGGWVNADFDGGWTCHIEQGAYGHLARKATWLFAHGVELPSLRWGSAPGNFLRLDDGFHSAEERRRAIKTGACQRLSHKQRAATPLEFRDLLISIARTAGIAHAAV